MKKVYISLAAVFLILFTAAIANAVVTYPLLSGATTTVTSSAFQPRTAARVFQAIGRTTSGAGAVSVTIEGSQVGGVDGNWKTLGTISLVLSTTPSNDGFASDTAWRHIRAKVDSISGTGASVDAIIGAE